MLLAREFVSYISRKLVQSLTAGTIETSNPEFVAERIAEVISEELAVEDRLNDEVRDLLSEYSEYMRREGVSYQEMFRRIKKTLISQRKVIRASGRPSATALTQRCRSSSTGWPGMSEAVWPSAPRPSSPSPTCTPELSMAESCRS